MTLETTMGAVDARASRRAVAEFPAGGGVRRPLGKVTLAW